MSHVALNCVTVILAFTGPEEEKEAKLSIKDLRKLFRVHRSISFLWRNIAIELGLPLAALRTYDGIGKVELMTVLGRSSENG